MPRSPVLPLLLLALSGTGVVAAAAPAGDPATVHEADGHTTVAAAGEPTITGPTALSRPTDPASAAGRPVPADPDVAEFFSPPATELPDGTLRHTPYDRPRWARAFDPDAAPEWEFVPAPAPDLFVAEPDYGDVASGMVHVASAVLGRPMAWEMTGAAAEELVAEAAREAAVLTTLTDTAFDREGILEASDRLGQPAENLWDVDVGLLAGAAAGSLDRALTTWDAGVDEGAPVGTVTAALRTAQERAGLPQRLNGRNLARLSTRTAIERADGASHGGVTVDLGAPETLAGLLQRRDLTVRLPDGARARGHVLVWHPDDPDIELATDLATGWGGRATVADAAARLGAVAAVNGGFWLDDAEPDGLLVRDGHMLSDATAWTGTQRGVRGAIGVRGDEVMVDRPDWQVRLQQGDRVLGVDALNRPARPGQTVAWNADGPTPSGTAGSWWLVPGVGRTGEAIPVPGPRRPHDGQLLVATDHDLSGRWTVSVAASQGWEELQAGLAGGPRLVYDGSPTPAGWWLGEGFATAHTHQRHPRTAVGVDAYGALITVVVDGRQPGWSAGTTQAETQSVMLALGVRDATMLDGGGSTQLVVDGALRNRPCCDARTRPVATVAAFVPSDD